VVGRLTLATAAAFALMLALVPGSRAQTTDTRNRALIVLDASKSMNDDAGSAKLGGGSRLAAAKQAVGTLVERLPAGARIGLRVYGSKVSEASRAEGCKDTELTIPVGPLDKQALTGAVNGLTGKGRTPIGNSLLAVPDDLGSAAGRRSVVLVTDGGDNCAPPDPCKAAEQVAKRGVDLSISVVGFQVNDRVRRQLRCIAAAGGGSYADVTDAGKLGDELAALLSRAFRSFEPSGTKVTGGAATAQATGIGPGLFQDVVAPGAEGRWYAVDVPEGQRLVVAATAIPAKASRDSAAFYTELLGPSGTRVAFESQLLHGGSAATVYGAVVSHSLRSRPGDPPGRYTFGVQVKDPTPQFTEDVPVEIGVQLLKPGETVGLTRTAGALATPTASPAATPRASATAAPGESGGGGITGWLIVFAVAVLGLGLGLAAAAVLGRRSAA
jgi:Ca-activated chloride channel family protein